MRVSTLLSGLKQGQASAVVADYLARLAPADIVTLYYSWRLWARLEQLPPPGNWRVWLVMAGRGWGKTRTGAEWVRWLAETGRAGRIALVGETAIDTRDVMVEGHSGLLAVAPPHCRPLFEPSKRRLTWPNGTIASLFSADDPDQLRGPQFNAGWADEIAKWRHPATWDNLLLSLRLGDDPRVLATTTPRPLSWIRALMADPLTRITGGATRDNIANLAPTFLSQITKQYEGTRLGRQELEAEMLDENPEALWRRQQIESLRVPKAPELARVVVAVDPAVSSAEKADETGIIVAALGADGHGYVLADYSLRAGPDGWARAAVDAYHRHKADRIVAEANQGGDLVHQVIRTIAPHAAYRAVHATRGKRVRAEPIAALYEQGRIHHVGGFPALEDQMCAFSPESYTGSPDRLDAMVWAFSDLMLTERRKTGVVKLTGY